MLQWRWAPPVYEGPMPVCPQYLWGFPCVWYQWMGLVGLQSGRQWYPSYQPAGGHYHHCHYHLCYLCWQQLQLEESFEQVLKNLHLGLQKWALILETFLSFGPPEM